jgi:sortase B
MSVKKKRRIKWKNVTLFCIFLIFLVIFIISIINVIRWLIDSNNTNNQITNIIEKTDIINIEDNENTELIVNEDEIKEFDPYWDYITVSLINVDISTLKKENKDTVGWIQVNGTNINYPFVQTTDNSFYLSHTFNKSYNKAGWVFMDYRNNKSEFDKNTILYAHGRADRTMFGSLRNILTNGWLNNKDNHIIKLSTEEENTLWQVFSVYRIPTTSDYLKIEFKEDEFLAFANKLMERSKFNFNTTISENDKILTLSTCYNDSDKIVLHAKLIKKEKR